MSKHLDAPQAASGEAAVRVTIENASFPEICKFKRKYIRVVLKYRSSFSAESTKNLAQRPTCTPLAPQEETPLVSDVPASSEPDVQTALYCTRISVKSAAK